jgi:hypothetical protein
MAMVRISRDLIKDVVSVAEEQFTARYIRTRNNQTLPMTGDELYDLTFGRWYNGMMSMPKEFFHWTNSLNLMSIGSMNCFIEFNLSSIKPIPMNYPGQPEFRRAEIYGPSMRIRLLQCDQWQPLADAIRSNEMALTEINNQKAAFSIKLTSLLNNHTTLAAALKEWPPLWDFLSDEVKERHNAPTVRNKRVIPDVIAVPEVDTATLTSLATLNKITL